MEHNKQQEAYELAVVLVNCFPPLHCASTDVVGFLKRAFQLLLPLQRTPQADLLKLVLKRAETASTLLLGSADIARKDIADLLPDINYAEYTKALHQPEALECLEAIQRFVENFNCKFKKEDVSEEKTEMFHEFVKEMTSKLALIWPQKSQYALSECVECHIASLLHDRHFPAASAMDESFASRVSALDFIELSHLEIPEHCKDSIPWQFAKEALLKMDYKNTPRDKIRSIFECFKILAEGLLKVQKGPVGADDLIPCVIYLVLKANPPHIHSNLQYITLFRSPDQMMCESGYFHVSLFSAVSFIENLTAQQLAINPETYARAMMGGRMESNPGDVQLLPVIPRFGEFPCTKCEGLGGLGTFGPCARTATAYLGICPACKGSGYFPGGKPCDACEGKGGQGVLGYCEVYDAFFTSFCGRCKGLCYINDSLTPREEVVPVVELEKLTISNKASQEVLVDRSFQGIDKRALFASLIAIALEGKCYDSRIRCALQRAARQISLPPLVLLELEQAIVDTLLQHATSSNMTSSPSTLGTISSFRPLKILAAAAAGGAALALTGGLAAPLVGHLLGVMGLGALISAMTTTTGVGGGAILSILFGAAGASVAAEKMVRKTAGLEQFEFAKVQAKNSDGTHPHTRNTEEYIDIGSAFVKNHNYTTKNAKKKGHDITKLGSDNKGLHVVVGVPGWETEGKECVCGVWSKALYDISGGYGDHFVLAWEGQYLKKLGSALKGYSEAHTNSQAESLAKKMASKVLYPALLSTTLIQEASVVDSPWTIVRDRAEKAGILLAHELIEGRVGARPVTLVGTSMGARVIFHCLEELTKIQNNNKTAAKKDARDPSSIIENVVFIGAAVPADMLRWASVRTIVAGRMINCYDPEDDILNVIYKTVHWFADGIYSPAGVAPVPSHPQHTYLSIENINVCDKVDTHMDYQSAATLKYILGLCNLYSLEK